MKKKTVLFIDHRIHADSSLINLFRNNSDFNMIYCDSIDEVILRVNDCLDIVIIEPIMETNATLLTKDEQQEVNVSEGLIVSAILLRKIRKTNPNIPIIFLTTLHYDPSWKEEFYNISHLRKPTKFAKIKNEVEKLLS